MIREQALNLNNSDRDGQNDRLEILRSRINDENYLHNAIQKMALVMSNELTVGNKVTRQGGFNERKRR